MAVKEQEVKGKEVKAVTQEAKEKEAKAVAQEVKKESKAEKIRKLYLEGVTYYGIAKQLGLRAQYVRNVILNAVESPSGYKDIKAEYERRLKAKQAAKAEV